VEKLSKFLALVICPFFLRGPTLSVLEALALHPQVKYEHR
jgi:hypothetical protein